MNQEDLDNRFTFHERSREVNAQGHQQVRTECGRLAAILNETLPEGREKSLAVTHLEEVMMWSNAAIARSDF